MVTTHLYQHPRLITIMVTTHLYQHPRLITITVENIQFILPHIILISATSDSVTLHYHLRFLLCEILVSAEWVAIILVLLLCIFNSCLIIVNTFIAGDMHNIPLTTNQIRNLNGGQQRNFAPNQQPPPNQQRNSRGMNRVSNRTCML